VPTTCSPYVIEMLYNTHLISTNVSNQRWCDNDENMKDDDDKKEDEIKKNKNQMIPALIIRQNVWKYVIQVLTNTLPNESTASTTSTASIASIASTASTVSIASTGSSNALSRTLLNITNEKTILQCVLDLSILDTLCSPKNRSLTELKNTMSNKIDPVEWTLYESLIKDNVYRQVERMQFYTGNTTTYNDTTTKGSKRSVPTKNTYGYSEDNVSQNILPMALTPGRFPLLPVARVGRKKSLGSSPTSPRSPNHESSTGTSNGGGQDRKGVSDSGTTASGLFSSITTSFWGD
jgi:hypothetical protein